MKMKWNWARVLLTTSIAALLFAPLVCAAPPPGKGKDKLTLSVSVSPASISEAAGVSGAIGTVSLNKTVSSSVVVSLSSSDTSEANIAGGSSIIIPAGTLNATFPIDAVDDVAADGDQSVTISAAATDYRSGSANLTVTDDETTAPPTGDPGIQYQLTLLGTLGGLSSRALDINNHGDVVGWARVADGTSHAFLSQVNGNGDYNMVDINSLVDTDLVLHEATGVNDQGQITGWGRDTEGVAWPFRYSLSYIDVTTGLTVPAVYNELETPPGTYNAGGDHINASGDIVGSSIDDSGTRVRYFVWLSDGGFLELPDLGIGARQAVRINDVLQVTGVDYRDVSNGQAHRTSVLTQQIEPLGFVSRGKEKNPHSGGSDINELGWITGSSTYAQGGQPNTRQHAFRYRNGVMEDLGTLGGVDSYGSGINLFGDVAGSAKDSGGIAHAFLYTDGDNNGDGIPDGMLNLDDLLIIPFPGHLGAVGGINDWGVICGLADPDDTSLPYQAFVLTPVAP